MSAQNILIEVENLTKGFLAPSGEIIAIQDISFQVPKGQMLAVVGKSGSGKSTLLNMLAGIDYPSKGAVSPEFWPLRTSNIRR